MQYKWRIMAIDSYPNNIAIIQSDIDGIRNWDINYVKAKRRENAEIIINTLNKDVLVYDSLNSSDVPFFVPIFLPGDARMKLCEMLDKNNIFCSILWGRPDGYRGTCNMYDADFGLVCDERYNTTQIHNMVGLINGCLEEFDLRCV